MLAKPHSLFNAAFVGHYAIGAFNTSNLEMAQAIIWAAEKQKAPVIVQTSEGAIEYAGLKVVKALIGALADDVRVPVVLHLDHGKKVELVRQCIEEGFTSVMIDASTLPLPDNIKRTQEVVQYAHDRGVWVEAELGAILGQEGARGLGGKRTPDEFLTNPEQAAAFVETTGVDALAVSVGTIHGAFTGQEYIRFELLEKLEAVLPGTPLVVHGASGIADEHLKKVTAMNVCKINVDTELRLAFEQAVRAFVQPPHQMVDIRALLSPGREAAQAVVESKIKLFGSTGKARYT